MAKVGCPRICCWMTTSLVLAMCVSGDYGGRQFVTFRLQEEQPVGTPVGNLTDSVLLMHRREPETSRKLHFQLISDDAGVVADRFSVNADSGMLTAAGSIDREEICSSALRASSRPRADDVCVVHLRVQVSPVGDVDVGVVIDDVNDHTPTFASAESSVNVSFPETATPGTLTQLPTATDRDAGQNGRLSYELMVSTQHLQGGQKSKPQI